jgi:hypothetical protein
MVAMPPRLFARSPLRPTLEHERAPEHERHREEGEHGDARREPEEDRADHDHGRGHLQEVVRAPVEKALELVDIVVEHRHQSSGRAILEVREVEALEMVVDVAAELVLDRLREIPPENRVGVLENRLERPDDQRQTGEDQELIGGLGEPPAGKERILAAHDDVDCGPDEERRREIEHLVEDREGGRADEAAAMAARVAEEAEERVHPLPLPGLGVDVKPADPGRHSFGASAARR